MDRSVQQGRKSPTPSMSVAEEVLGWCRQGFLGTRRVIFEVLQIQKFKF